uniref:CCT-theta n=1 Tax=Fibrocapsa japonica TaxID=94617 RepID=A0A7S2V2T8_9STRA|mmetsp:Transcript_3787/g.5626  ORF Transcript_3787/g.5626 Transcript_3787/m.5626 type:complete len:557 (+) Transcript_3787:100-1770(+)|eukprot:CAMPEP_0113933800 /NCGR_PEP_ID=MMETSP1339-20121228/1117_1 /TAXON_ID=94617 /ORGANISM="Fibrocapsa japonica" /LENGTH=556 /DNA_ID=CAMNT_0000935273 /DNA_START=78 /DNA_END=1748 /DNA_ORIENTATION=+ /assembly_acc=CAM_ASM_000762
MAKSMALNQAAGLTGMLKDGHSTYSGLDEAVLRNIKAAKDIASIVSSSMGPNGLKKLVVNHLEKVIVTSDCSAIIKELEIQHPAAKVLELAAKQQETEFGDGTNLVMTFAGELLKLAEDLYRMGLHTSEIVEGYRRALDESMGMLDELVVPHQALQTDQARDQAAVAHALQHVVATKQHGYQHVLSDLVAEACLIAATPGPGPPRLNVQNVRVAKLRGGSVLQSKVVRGMVILRDTENSIKLAENAKVTVFGCGIEAAATEAKGTVLIHSAEELLSYNKGEEAHMHDIIKQIADSGCKVVICGGSISEMAMHFLTKYHIMAIKVPSKWELRRACETCNATALVRLGAATPDEMGSCSKVEVREMGGRKVIVMEQDQGEDTRLATIVLRASTDAAVNDHERAVDDAVQCCKALWKDGRVVAGGGAAEMALARKIREFGQQTTGLDQYAIKKFADALESVPRILAETSGMDGTDALAQLNTIHASGNSTAGVIITDDDVELGKEEAGQPSVVDSLAVKKAALNLAADAAITVLRVDQIIMAKQAGGPAPGGPPGAGGM